jgi:hypothetical protein
MTITPRMVVVLFFMCTESVKPEGEANQNPRRTFGSAAADDGA